MRNGAKRRAPIPSPTHQVNHIIILSGPWENPAGYRYPRQIVALTAGASTQADRTNLKTPCAVSKALIPCANLLTRYAAASASSVFPIEIANDACRGGAPASQTKNEAMKIAGQTR